MAAFRCDSREPLRDAAPQARHRLAPFGARRLHGARRRFRGRRWRSVGPGGGGALLRCAGGLGLCGGCGRSGRRQRRSRGRRWRRRRRRFDAPEHVRLRDPAVLARPCDGGRVEPVLGGEAPGGGPHHGLGCGACRRRPGASRVSGALGAVVARFGFGARLRLDARDDLLALSGLPFLEDDLGEGPGLRRRHLEHHLVGLQLDQHVPALDPVAGPELPGEQRRVGDRFGQGRDPERLSAWRSLARRRPESRAPSAVAARVTGALRLRSRLRAGGYCKAGSRPWSGAARSRDTEPAEAGRAGVGAMAFVGGSSGPAPPGDRPGPAGQGAAPARMASNWAGGGQGSASAAGVSARACR